MLWRRPQNRFEEANNLFIVGGGTHPGSGLPTIFESARISSKLVLDDLGIDPDWNGVDTWFEGVRRSRNGRKAQRSITTTKETGTPTNA
jgi:phytoene desaturase